MAKLVLHIVLNNILKSPKVPRSQKFQVIFSYSFAVILSSLYCIREK